MSHWRYRYHQLLNRLTKQSQERYGKQIGGCPLYIFGTAEHGYYSDVRLGVTRHTGEDLLTQEPVPNDLREPELWEWIKRRLDENPLAVVVLDNPVTIARWESEFGNYWYELYYDGIVYSYKGNDAARDLEQERRVDAINYMETVAYKMKRVL